MKTLIVEDDFVSRLLLQELLSEYGPCNVAVEGGDALEEVNNALQTNEPYDLICLDIMMPGMDGQAALKEIRSLETTAGHTPGRGAKIVMTTALSDADNILAAFRNQCDAYIIKPIAKTKLLAELRKLKLIK